MATVLACTGRADLLSAYLLGQSLGRHTELSEPPACFSSAERAEFRRGWADGEQSRVPFMGDPDGPLPIMEHTREDEVVYAAMVHGDDHDAQFDPESVEVIAQAPDDYWDSLAEFEDWENGPGEWSERARVLGHRIHAAGEGVAA